MLEEAARSLICSHNDLRRRRRTFARLFSHTGIKATFEKIRGTNVDPSVEDLLRPRGVISGPVPAPAFARDLALLKEFGVVGSIRPGLRRDDEGKSADRLSDPDSSKLEGRKPF